MKPSSRSSTKGRRRREWMQGDSKFRGISPAIWDLGVEDVTPAGREDLSCLIIDRMVCLGGNYCKCIALIWGALRAESCIDSVVSNVHTNTSALKDIGDDGAQTFTFVSVYTIADLISPSPSGPACSAGTVHCPHSCRWFSQVTSTTRWVILSDYRYDALDLFCGTENGQRPVMKDCKCQGRMRGSLPLGLLLARM